MLLFVICGLIAVFLVTWMLRMQRETEAAEQERRGRQRAQRLGLARIPGADGAVRRAGREDG